jgi:hypothetical protein
MSRLHVQLPAAQKGRALTDAPKKKRTGRRSETRQRLNGAFVRLDDKECAVVQLRAEEAGLSTAAYLRACALGDAGPRARRSPTINRELAAQAIAELNKAGSNLNQIARAVNMKNWPGTTSVAGAADTVTRAALQILQAFGYKTHDSQGQPA